jgi:hypothetical protein
MADGRLNINCHNEIREIPAEEEVEEAAGCQYEATINHQMGCPLECPRNSVTGRVCSARGLCFYGGYDSGAQVDTNDDVSISNRSWSRHPPPFSQ